MDEYYSALPPKNTKSKKSGKKIRLIWKWSAKDADNRYVISLIKLIRWRISDFKDESNKRMKTLKKIKNQNFDKLVDTYLSLGLSSDSLGHIKLFDSVSDRLFRFIQTNRPLSYFKYKNLIELNKLLSSSDWYSSRIESLSFDEIKLIGKKVRPKKRKSDKITIKNLNNNAHFWR